MNKACNNCKYRRYIPKVVPFGVSMHWCDKYNNAIHEVKLCYDRANEQITGRGMEYNWIEAKTISNGKHIKVRQGQPGGRLWIDTEGTMYTFVDLDFTINFSEMRRDARNKAIKSHKTGIWAGAHEVYLKEADPDDAETFIRSLGSLGYDTDELMDEYKLKGFIAI